MARLSLARGRSEMTSLSTWLDDQEHLLPILDDVSYAVRLCLEEAVSNIVNHTPEPSERPDITVDLNVQGDVLVATVEDHGPPFDPRAARLPARPANLDDAEPGGLGIMLMRSFASEIDYHALPGRNLLTFRFRRPVEVVPADHPASR